jgi:hypothetical protein
MTKNRRAQWKWCQRGGVSVTNDELLVQFLYILLRDHLPAGEVEKIIVDHVSPFSHLEVKYSNQFLEGYAREIAGRLRPV